MIERVVACEVLYPISISGIWRIQRAAHSSQRIISGDSLVARCAEERVDVPDICRLSSGGMYRPKQAQSEYGDCINSGRKHGTDGGGNCNGGEWTTRQWSQHSNCKSDERATKGEG